VLDGGKLLSFYHHSFSFDWGDNTRIGSPNSRKEIDYEPSVTYSLEKPIKWALSSVHIDTQPGRRVQALEKHVGHHLFINNPWWDLNSTTT